LKKPRSEFSEWGFLCPLVPILKINGRNTRKTADELLKRRTSKSFEFRGKTVLFFETEVFNFGGSNREKKIFALWKIYIRLTNRSPPELFEVLSKPQRPFCKGLLFTMLRVLNLEGSGGVENRKPM
jgi:hypothetical protein